MITGFDCYRIYLALKLHFKQDNYDYCKFQGQTKLKTGSFEKRPDRYVFQKLARKYDTKEKLEHFIVSNIIWNYGEFYAWKSVTQDAHDIYLTYMKIRGAYSYYFSEDLKVLKQYCSSHNVKNFLYVPANKYPELLVLLQQNIIRFETVFVLNKLRPFIGYWKAKITDEIIFPEVYKKFLKYEPFCANIDRSIFIQQYNKIMNS